MRIGWLGNIETTNGFYRSVIPMNALEQRGHRVQALLRSERDQLPPLGDLDVVHIHRFCGDRALKVARQARAGGAAVVWDDDDALETMPRDVREHAEVGGYAGARRLAALRSILRHVDLVTTPSGALAERLERLGAARSAVLENYVADELVQPPRKRPPDGVTIGWVIGTEHQADVARIPIREALQRLLDERPEVTVETVGLSLELCGERYRHIPPTRLDLLLSRCIVSWDAGIAPLADLEFNRARSNVKLKEYAAAGVTWLASPFGPYAAMGERQGGRLVADDRWHEELVRLVERPRERRKLAKRAARWAAGETISRNVERWEAAFAEAIERARSGAAA